MIDRIGGRKFVVGLGIMGVGVTLELKMPNGLSSTMAAFLVSMAVSYFAANITHAIKTAGLPRLPLMAEPEDDEEDEVVAQLPVAPPAVPAPPQIAPAVTAYPDELRKDIAVVQSGLETIQQTLIMIIQKAGLA